MTPGIRLGIRTRLLLAVVGALALALIIGVTAFNVILEQRLSASAESLARAQAQAELSSLKVENGKLVAPEGLEKRGAVGSTLWVFAGGTIIEKPLVPRRWTKAAASLAGGPEGTGRVQESVRLYALPVIYDGNAGASIRKLPSRATIHGRAVPRVAYTAREDQPRASSRFAENVRTLPTARASQQYWRTPDR